MIRKNYFGKFTLDRVKTYKLPKLYYVVKFNLIHEFNIYLFELDVSNSLVHMILCFKLYYSHIPRYYFIINIIKIHF